MDFDNDRLLSAASARSGIPALRHEAERLAGQIAACSAHVRLYQMKVDAVFAALDPNAPPPLPAEPVRIEIGLTPDEFDTAEIVISHLQAADRNLSIDDALNEIFTVGLAALAHRLIPS